MKNEDLTTPIVSSGTHQGIEWETRFMPTLKSTNGYARLPEGHPFRGLDLQWDDYDKLHVHGGITYGPTDDGWVGFDTSHSGDIWPGTPELLRGINFGHPEVRWAQEMVEDTTRTLCEQIAATMPGGDAA